MSFLIFFLALSLMVLVHELGHFLAAKKNGVKVVEFGLGMPPRLWARQIGETLYSLNLIPMGGFVRVWGMEEKVKKEIGRSFYHQAAWRQGLILVAGVVMNLVLALVVFSLVYGFTGVPEKMGYVQVAEVAPGSPAAQAGIKPKEIVVALRLGSEEVRPKETTVLVETVKKWAGKKISLRLAQEECWPDCPERWVELVPRPKPPPGEGAMGVLVVDTRMAKPPLWRRIPLGVWFGLQEAWFWGREIVLGVGRMVAELFRGQPPKELAGPVGIYKISSQVYQENGFLAVIHFFAIISVNLAIVNLFPLPGTDGWHLLILSWEKLRGRELSQELKHKINQWGMIFLFALFFLILVADLKRFFF